MQRGAAWPEEQGVQVWFQGVHQEMVSIAIHIILLSAQRCNGKAQAPASALGVCTQHFYEGFLELRTLKLFLPQFSQENTSVLL